MEIDAILVGPDDFAAFGFAEPFATKGEAMTSVETAAKVIPEVISYLMLDESNPLPFNLTIRRVPLEQLPAGVPSILRKLPPTAEH